MKEFRRTGKWAPGGHQKRVAVYTFGVCAVVFFINIFVLAVVLEVRAILWLQVILFVVAAVVLSFFVGRRLFSTLGPVHRFTKYFEDLSTGCWGVPCQIRTSDKHHELKDAINQAIEPLVQKIRDQDTLLHDACYELQQIPPADIEESRLGVLVLQMNSKRLGVLISQMTSEMADTAQGLNATKEDSGGKANFASDSPWASKSNKSVRS